MIRHMNKLQINLDELSTLIDINVDNLKEMYPDLAKNKEIIKSVILEEKEKFVKTLVNGEREFQNKVKKAVESMTGLKVVEVNVHIQGVSTENMGVENDKEEDKE